MIKLRPYQRQTIDAIKADFAAGFSDVMVTLATGGGKTAVFLSLLNEILSGNNARALVLAHRQELIFQPRDRMLDYYPEWEGKIGVVMADYDEYDRQITVATVQTLASERRREKLISAGAIDYLVTDECFPAGTMVDGKAIETLEVGDIITSYDEISGKLVPGKITQVMRRPAPQKLFKIKAGDYELVCTYNHPILTNNGWVFAKDINIYDKIKIVRYKNSLLSMPKGVLPKIGRSIEILSKKQKSVLLRSLQKRKIFIGNDSNEFEIRQRQNEEKQSNESVGCKKKNDCIKKRHWTNYSMWKWTWPIKTPKRFILSPWGWMGNGIRNTDEISKKKRISLSNLLQSRYSKFQKNDMYRGRWKFPLLVGKKSPGSKKTRFVDSVRVDGIKVLEQTDFRKYGNLCRDGYVYNLEVERYHTYIANNVIVHNCHHQTVNNSTYAKTLAALKAINPNLKHLGVTATPIRADGDGIGGVYQKESAHFGIVELIKNGYLVPVRWLAIQVGISLAGVKKVAGDFQSKQLANVFETQNCFDLVVESHKKYASDRQALAFTVSVEGAYNLAKTFTDAGIVAAAADGNTKNDDRKRILDDFRCGKIQVLCNVGLYTEGLDVPQVSCIHQVRPTQSDGLYTQILGRALRTYPGKSDALILDYAPLDTRNIAMAGDVLGTPIRKDAYIEEKEEEGDVLGGFTFDASGKFNWLKGNPAEIISRQLDYLDMSPFHWHRDREGNLSLGLGAAHDEIERTLVITAPENGVMALYLVAKRPDERKLTAYPVKSGEFDELSQWADEYSSKRGNATLAMKARAWHKQSPTEAQTNFAKRLGIKVNGSESRGVLAQEITHALALHAVLGTRQK